MLITHTEGNEQMDRRTTFRYADGWIDTMMDFIYQFLKRL